MRAVIFDAGPLISMTMNGILNILPRLKKVFDGDFVITPQVKAEVIDKPIKIKKYELEALKVQDLLDKGVLKMSSDFISNNELNKKTQDIMKKVNSSFHVEGSKDKIQLISDGEASCMAFAKICKCESLIVIDERTGRLLSEAPEKLHELMERKVHNPIKIKKENFDELKNLKYIRSSELVYIAYKKDLIDMKKSKQLLDALLYGLKFRGTAISSAEIEEMKQMA